MTVRKETLDLMRRGVAVEPNRPRARRAVYDFMVHRYGAEAVGPWEDYQPKPDGYWDIKENVLASAREHQTITAWHKCAGRAAASARKNGWFEEATAHMISFRVPNGYWDIKENVITSARKYETITAWEKAAGRAVALARSNGWFEEATAHMTRAQKPAGYWQVKENVLASAREYETISAWQKACPAAYHSARKNGWHEEATAHMR